MFYILLTTETVQAVSIVYVFLRGVNFMNQVLSFSRILKSSIYIITASILICRPKI